MFQLVAIFFSIPIIYPLHSGLNKLRKHRPTLPLAGPCLGSDLEKVLLVWLGQQLDYATVYTLRNCPAGIIKIRNSFARISRGRKLLFSLLRSSCMFFEKETQSILYHYF